MIYLGDFAANATVYIPWNTFDSNGASVTMTGLAATDIEVYKNGSVTQRASDNGYTLLDTDGTDFDGATGIHGISIDTSDNSDAGFYATGADYWVVINAVTVDSQTVRFVAAIFSIQNRLTSNIYSDTTVIASDVVIVGSDAAAIHSDTTIIASDVVIVVSDTTAIHSDTTIIASDVVVLDAAVSDVESSLVIVKSDLVVVESNSIVIESNTIVIESDTIVISSDTAKIESDTAVIESDTTRLELALVTTTGALEATPSSTVLQTDLAEASDDHYNNMVFVMTSGDEAGEARRILDYTGATGTVTLQTALSGAPTAAETFAILNIPAYGDAIYSDTTIVHSDTVVLTSDTAVIESDTAAIHSDTTIIASDVVILVSDTTAIHSDTTIIASDVVIIGSDVVQVYSDTTIIASDLVIVGSDAAAIHSDTTIIHSDTIVISSDTAVIESDVALWEAAHSEPTGVPAASASPLTKLGYLYMALRNQVTVTSSKKTFFDDAGTAEWEKDLSDDGTTYTETEGNAI